jgi:Immunity protein 8
MLTPVLRSLDSAYSEDIEALKIPEGRSFLIDISATIGVDGGTGGDLFNFVVASPDEVAQMAVEGPAFLRHVFLTPVFDIAFVRRAVEELCRKCEGIDWTESATKLSRYMHWEFEDYNLD